VKSTKTRRSLQEESGGMLAMVRRGQGNELEGGESGIGEQKCGLVPRLIPSHQLLGGFRLLLGTRPFCVAFAYGKNAD